MNYKLFLDSMQINKLIELYQKNKIELKNNYILFCAKIDTSTLTIYKTLTVLIQGKDSYELYFKICKLLNVKPVRKTVQEEINPRQLIIGTDEVGTGDVFGGIVVAGACASLEDFNFLISLGVKDNKQINDYDIMLIAPIIMDRIPYSIMVLNNLRYNFLTSHYHYNMNQIKAIMHNTVCNSMSSKIKETCPIVIDGFTSKNNYYSYLKNEKKICNDVLLIEKAENKYLSVACAGIIARYRFLKQLEEISVEINYDLPKGAGKTVDNAIFKIYSEKGLGIFKNIAKQNFKNFDKYRNN